jgi:hypothetical protein
MGEISGYMRTILRLEGLTVLLAAVCGYAWLDFSWGYFALFFLVPDLSLLAYLANEKIGAISYNLMHSYIGAVSCLIVGLFMPESTFVFIGLIWTAHIGFDRALGYGLKYSTGFKFTHLGTIGKQ